MGVKCVTLSDPVHVQLLQYEVFGHTPFTQWSGSSHVLKVPVQVELELLCGGLERVLWRLAPQPHPLEDGL